MRIVLVLYVNTFCRQRARNVGDNASYVENSGLSHAQIWRLTPNF